jgi:RNA polymerase sigma factor (sigma-70 family)
MPRFGGDIHLNMSDTDSDLLMRYSREGAEDAFTEIVRRHLNLVYSVALRQVRSLQLAEEIAQSAFTDLARNANRLTPDTIIAAWLYTVTHRAALNVVRREARRQLREQIASEMNDLNATPTDWTNIAPLLDEAMHALDETDRAAVLLRYFQNKPLREVGQILGTSDDTAQKRVSRAVERLREFFVKRGVTVGATGLVVVISTHAVQAAPFGLAATISGGAILAASAVSTSSSIAVTTALAMTTVQKTLITGLIVAAIATPLVIQHQTQVKLREENGSLRQQVDRLTQLVADNERLSAKRSAPPRLPPPRSQVAASPAQPPVENLRPTNLITRLLRLQSTDQSPKLTSAQIDSYLKANGRSAATLLAAFRATGDPALLQQAMREFPNDPQVTFTAVFNNDASPTDRRQWLDAFKQSSPQNSLANYLSALDYFRSGHADQAVLELNAATAKPQFQDYSSDFVQNDEEAWRAAGYSVAEAKTAASMLLLLPQLGQMKELTQDVVSLANSYRQSGDETSAQMALQAGLSLGQRLDGSPGQSLVSQLTGAAIQSIALRSMDPTAPYGQDGQTVQARLDELAQQRAAIVNLTSQFDTMQERVSDQDWISYKDRWRSFGEEAALRWLVGKYGQN